MENRTDLIAPCGLDCGICELYLSRDNEAIRQHLMSVGIPSDALPCDGCRSRKGQCPVQPGTCATFECADRHGVTYCSECDEFPCGKLAPAADQASTLPHNVKLCNLCVVDKHGAEELTKRSGAIKKAYYRGKMVIGEGPQLPD